MNIITHESRIKLLNIMQQTICDDYCFLDNCRNCNDKRLDMIQPVLVENIVLWLQHRRIVMKSMVDDGLWHEHSLIAIDELLVELNARKLP
jgi:hypothetical protein